ncbi:MAG: LysM peptidoglycan-binding domain-containing protein [Puniceicoccales bacterium]|nr:LysM peptidoglycan-binding domain-containing protein [Puniceicoccales bacterium]
MKNTLMTSLALSLALFLGAPRPAHAQSAAKIAGLEQEMATVREELQRLREEVQDLRAALRNAQAQSSSTSAANASVQQQLNANAHAIQAQDLEMKRRVTLLAEQTNRALADLARRVDAVAGGANVAGPETNPVRPSPPPIPPGMPSTGVPYKIKPGDNPDRIARAHNSRVEWILAANKIADARRLKIGQEIFIPQRALPPAPPQAVPAPPANTTPAEAAATPAGSTPRDN